MIHSGQSHSPSPTNLGTQESWRAWAPPLLWNAHQDRGLLNELQTLERAGRVQRLIAEFFLDSQTVPTALIRARAIADMLTRHGLHLPAQHWAIGFETASWIHIGSPEPTVVAQGLPVLHIVLPPGGYRPATRAVRFHEHHLDSQWITELGGVRLTTASRTAADLARTLDSQEVSALLHQFGNTCGLAPAHVARALTAMPRHRGVTEGKRAVRAWSAELRRGHPLR